MPPRMRTLSAAFAWLQKNDPETGLTKTALRRLVVNGTIPSVRIGEGSRPKYLVDIDNISDYLHGAEKPETAPVAGIRRIQA